MVTVEKLILLTLCQIKGLAIQLNETKLLGFLKYLP